MQAYGTARTPRAPDETPGCYSGGNRKVQIDKDCKDLIAAGREHASVSPRLDPRTANVPQRATASSCNDCGVVTRVEAVEQEGEGGWTGKIGGAVVGGLLGNQIGGGTGKTIATVAGAAGGAYAGNEVQKQVSKKTVYQVSFKLNSGTTRTVKFDNADHGYRKGDKIRFENGLLSHR
ncbi:glycine zipper 2TM domain-containing protein [Jeongeupia naejangsanensis]|uniref:Glycine zipper 2TM domain-containing protein n=2 Tax=Jeongeupia naejangsanensis TaxID=613195 RepID=A0ABS2BHG2_9NEIS|nr:glycine zipper 2TM domain-containing protein [Jeongeupia naejangsanensis]